MANRVVYFEIQADEPQRAIRFYSEIFGWNFQKWEGSPTPYWMVMTADKDSKEPGINGGLLARPCPAPPTGQGTNAYTCTVQVGVYDEIHEKIMKAGGTIAIPKFPIPSMAWQGYYVDTEGNVFGIHQPDTNAK